MNSEGPAKEATIAAKQQQQHAPSANQMQEQQNMTSTTTDANANNNGMIGRIAEQLEHLFGLNGAQ